MQQTQSASGLGVLVLLVARFVVALLMAALPAQSAGVAAHGAPVDFDRDVRPVLAGHCFRCHGPDVDRRKAGLRFDRREVAFAPRGVRPPAIVAGDPDASELVRRITDPDPAQRMPPSVAEPLTERDRQILIEWIRAGATWKEHWAFVPPRTPDLPPVLDREWPHGGIDAFVLARLEAAGLRPSPPADRRTLIRRVTLDLTGLPPAPADVVAFLHDASPDAYEKVVDRLLATDAYGEHMARYWLDAARYGDTHGLHLDNYREMWLYRDWVIHAFRDGMPFDRFALEQIAGDLLPDATVQQRIASGFNRCHVTTNEGGSITEEVLVRNVIDRVSTTGTVFLGLTLGCAVCHDHKFDPISQKEFYQVFAFFNNLDGDAMDGNAKAPAPVVHVPSVAQARELEALHGSRTAVVRDIDDAVARFRYEEPPEPNPAVAPPRRTIVWIDDDLPKGAVVEGDAFAWVEAPGGPVHSGRRSMRRTSRGLQQHFFKRADTRLRIGAGDELFAWVHLDPSDRPREIMLQWNADGGDDWGHRAYWGENLIAWGADGTGERFRAGDLPAAGAWVRLAVPAAAVGLRPGTAVHGIAITQHDGAAFWDAIGVESSAPQQPEDHVWIDDAPPAGSRLEGDGSMWQFVGRCADAEVPPAGGARPAVARPPDPPVFHGARSLRRSGKGLVQDFFTGAPRPLALVAGDRLFAHVWLDPQDPPRSVQLQFHDGSWEHRVRWGAPAHGAGGAGGADHVEGSLPPTGRWVRLEVGIAEVGLVPGRRLDGWAFTQVDGTVYWDAAGVRTWAPPDESQRTSQRGWEIVAAADQTLPEAVRKAIAVPRSQRDAQQGKLVRDHFVRHVFAGSRAVFDPLDARLVEVDRKIAAIEAVVPTTLVMKERAQPRPAFVLARGQYDQPRAKIERVTPAVLPPMAPDLPRDRLGFARWLVDPRHPLTARVAVNRFWQQVFGIGLVRTSEDFGNQGERPSHPELLDWLATRFVADGWDVKALMRRIVLSATYRQSSRVTPALQASDPENRRLARGPRFRLDAEALRDQALALGALLVTDLGGPSVRPPQPDGLWKAVGYVGSNTDRFVADTGNHKVHRRSLYTFWKRTAPPPQMTTFDAPSRESCTVRRERTNTPLQALLLLNDPQYVEAARGLAARVLTPVVTPDADARRIDRMFELATCRVPSEGERAELLSLLRSQRAVFAADPSGARRLTEVGPSPPDPKLDPIELAAWTIVANLVLNLDEVLTKG